MNENDGLQILIEAALDFEKSLTTMTAQMNQLQEKFKSYQIKITAGLNQTASAAQIKKDLKQLNAAKNHVRLVGQMDQDATKKNVAGTVKKLKNTEVQLTGLLDTASTQKNVQEQLQQLRQIPQVEAKANVSVEGAEQVDQLSQKMDKASNSASNMAAKVYLARTALQALRRAAQEAKDTVVELDKAATDLAIVTGSGSEEAYVLLKEYNQMAQQLGATTTQISDAAAEWLRQGKTAAETATLIEQSMILSKVGAMESATATQNLTSAMKGYGMAVEDVSRIVDKLTAIDLKAAVTASDLAVAMSRTANSANISGVSMDRLLGYLATVEEVTQKSAETIGESFKTIFARMGNIKLDNYLDDDGEDLSDVETVLKSFGIALRGVDGDFRNFAEVLDDVYAKWEQFGAIDKRAIANAFAGTRQQENFLVLMENYGKALEYAGVAADSAGTALEKFSAYEDSIGAKAAAFTAALESLTMDTIDSDLVKDLIDAGTAVIEFAEQAGLLRAALISIGAGATMKGVKLISDGFNTAKQSVLNLGTAINTLREVDDIGSLAGNTINTLGKLTKGLSDEQLKLVLTSRQLSTAQMEAILMASGLSAQEAKQKIETLGLAASQETATGATWSLSAAMTGLGASIKAAFAANPIGMTMMAISAVVTVVSLLASAWEEVKQRAEEARQSMTEAAEAANDQRNSLADLIAEYKELATAGDFDSSARETAKRIQKDITDLVGAQADNLDLVNGKLDDEIKKLDNIKLQTAYDARDTLDTKYRDAMSRYNQGINAEGSGTNFLGVVTDAGGIDQILQKIGYVNDAWENVNGQISISYALSGKNAEEALAMYKELQHLLLNNDSWQSMADDPWTGWIGISSQDILNNVQQQIEFYQGLVDDYNSAQENFLKNEAVIDLGETLKTTDINSQEAFDGYIQGIKSSTEYSEAYKKILLELANDTFPEFSGAMQQATNNGGTSVYIAQLEKLTDVISGLQSSYDALASAESDMSGGGGLSAETIESLAGAEEKYLDYLYEENGVVKLNTAAWKENANAKMQGEMNEIQKEIDSIQERNAALQESIKYYEEQRAFGNDGGMWSNLIAETAQEIEENNKKIAENQNLLGMYDSIFDSIVGKTGEWAHTLQVFDDCASSLEKLADVQAAVSDGYKISAEKARELAAVYPEVLEQATLSANGQVALNEAIVNSFIKGKETEIKDTAEAEILKLQAKEALLQAELDIVESQIEAAKAGDEETVKSANETAAAKMALEQAVLSACEQAGIDETTANQLATAAMTGDWDTFSKLAQQAVYDLDDESAVSFTNVMTNFAQMASNMVDNTNKVIGAFSQMGTALKNAMNGISTSGVANTVSAGGGLSGGGKEAVSGILSDMFEAEKSDHGSDRDSFDDALAEWQKQLQNIVDGYVASTEVDLSALKAKRDSINDQIASVQSQILTLQSLKETPLDKFSSSAKSGGKSSKKEVEEYVATIDDYREAVERLRKAQEARAELETKIDNSDDLREKILLERQLIGAYQREQEALHNLNNQRDSTITAGVKALRDLGFEVQYNADTNELWIENMEHLNKLTADSKGKYDTLQEATNALRKETEDLIGSLTDLNEENRDGSENWKELGQDTKEARKQIMELLDGIVEEASDAVDTIQNVYDTLHDAADEYAESGFITVDTLQSVRAMGQKYLAYLIDENGQLVINEERIRAVIAAKTQELAIESSLSYIEALRIAKQEGDIATLNNLLYATEEATDATWDFVYANLALAGLDEDQYQAALKNINALRALADSACESIGQTANRVTNELEEMQNGLNNILDYVMDMLKQRIQDQIDGLEDMKDAYSEIISLKKESLQASKDEATQSKTMATRLRKIAKLQARIDALSLDDSREAQAEKAALLEELSELQSDLADEQADRTLEAQEDALDKMEESYHDEKDKEIEILEDSISSYQKLYDMAISYIESHWDTLYSELISWNTQYGDVLNSEIANAWDNCLAAAQRYGDYVTALSRIGVDIEASHSAKGNSTIGDTEYDSTFTSEEGARAAVNKMKENSALWGTASQSKRAALERDNRRIAQTVLPKYGVYATLGGNGVWYLPDGRKLYEVYHNGGVVGNGDIKSNEQLALLKDREWVLSEKMVDNLIAQMDRVNKMRVAFEQNHVLFGKHLLSDQLKLNSGSTVNNVTTTNNRPVEIIFGDTVIQGADQSTVEQHIKVTEDMVNQIGRIIGIRK